MPAGPRRRELASAVNTPAMCAGLTDRMLVEGVRETYRLLDTIDATLLASHGVRLADLVELANLSSIIGNLLALSIVKASGGVFTRAGAHKYQDLRASGSHPDARPIEIKIALERNRPKGHLPKAGHYLTCRYMLRDEHGDCVESESGRGNVVWIWELRLGELNLDDFMISNTAGDSGKTANVTVAGMKKLKLVYFDRDLCPFTRVEKYLRDFGDGYKGA